MIQLGLKSKDAPRVQTKTDPFNGDAVITLKKIEGRTRGIEFSQGALEMMGIWQRELGEGTTGFTNTTISCANDAENGNLFLFVNSNNLEVDEYDVNKTTMGFRNKAFYDLLVEKFSVDTTVDTHLTLVPYEQDDINATLYAISEVWVNQNQLQTA